MRFIIVILLCGLYSTATAQQDLVVRVTGGDSAIPVIANLHAEGIEKVLLTDERGLTIVHFIKNGKFFLDIEAFGYETLRQKINIPYIHDTIHIELVELTQEMEEVIIQSTRTGRTIANIPTRVEIIDEEEVEEKANMRPANISMLLHESTGIQVQQNSPTTGSSNIKIQGLDGKYTQLLKDGYANFGNFSGGLSLLEIPPLDIDHVEIIKGPASTLFGGGTIAGVVNLISKTPKDKPEGKALIDQSSIGQTTAGGFYSQKRGRTGFSVLGMLSRQLPFDVDKDHFTEVPKTEEFTFTPKLFLYPSAKTRIQIGSSIVVADRNGGDVQVIKESADSIHRYFEKNKTIRNLNTFSLTRDLVERRKLEIKQSLSFFERSIEMDGYSFNGSDFTSFTDVAVMQNKEKQGWVVGGNLVINNFKEKGESVVKRNNEMITGGLYGQCTWDMGRDIKIEGGIRADGVQYKYPAFSNSELFLLPRVSFLVKYNSQWSSRLSLGMGYKAPTLFTEETETIQYRDVQLHEGVSSEKSLGGTADINWRKNWDEVSLTFNQMFFYTHIDDPLVFVQEPGGSNTFINAQEPVISSGFESNLRCTVYENFKIFLGYTYTNAVGNYKVENKKLPLVPEHKFNSALIYEKEASMKFGFESYLTSSQYLSDGSRTPSYWDLGLMAEKIFRKFSVYINFENFLDTRQSKFKTVTSGPHPTPVFDEIWTHTEGIIINGGIKIRW